MTLLSASLACGALAVGWIRDLLAWRPRRRWAQLWDSTEDDVLAVPALLRGEVIVGEIVPGPVPIVRPRAITVAPSPLLHGRELAELVARAERAGEFAEAITRHLTAVEARKGPGRHRHYGTGRDVVEKAVTRLRAINTPTQEFDALIFDGFGEEITEHGPAETVVAPRRTWTAATAAQPVLQPALWET